MTTPLEEFFAFLVQSQPWMAEANCRGMGEESSSIFFPKRGDSKNIQLAKAVCQGCPVRRECREYADSTGSNYGIWDAEVRNPKVMANQRKIAAAS